MRRGIVAFSALTLIGLGVTGCGLFRFEQREPWRAQAEEACLAQRLVQNTAYMSRSSPIDGPGACGISYPIKVAALADGSVGLTNKATLACPIIPNIDAWLNEVVQPAASLYFGAAVVDVKSGSYSCRPRNSRSGAKLSEHSFGNALDVMGFHFADGRQVTVVKGWRGAPEEQQFLREVFVGACQYFNTVLGPGADMFHYDHFHLDLARHDPRGVRRLCKPILKFTSRLDRPDAARPAATRQPDAWRSPDPQSDVDIEEDSDPFAVSGRAPRQSLGSARPAQPPAITSSSWSAVPPAPPARAYEARFTQPPPASAPGPSRITSAPLAPPSALQLPAPRARGQAYYQEPPLPRPSPTPPVISGRSAPGWSASPPPKNAQAPLPPARTVGPAEPSPPYDLPPPRRAPVVLQPQPWNGHGIY